MISKLAVTALMIAALPVMGAATADAADGKGKGNKASHAKHIDTASKKASRGNTVVKYVAKTNGAKVIVVHNKPNKHFGNRFNNHFNNRFGNRGFSCVAAAKTRGGFGHLIPGIRGERFGGNACQRAMNECRHELRHRKASGRNPFARCVVVRRG